jgi:hypothetical protein
MRPRRVTVVLALVGLGIIGGPLIWILAGEQRTVVVLPGGAVDVDFGVGTPLRIERR